MAEDIKEQPQEKTVLDTKPVPQPTVTMAPEAILRQIQAYRMNADSSLAKIQENVDKLTAQLNELQKMRLMVIGQRELVQDLYTKMVGQTEAQQESK